MAMASIDEERQDLHDLIQSWMASKPGADMTHELAYADGLKAGYEYHRDHGVDVNYTALNSSVATAITTIEEILAMLKGML